MTTMRVNEAAMQVINAWDELLAEAAATVLRESELGSLRAQFETLSAHMGILARCLCAGVECPNEVAVDFVSAVELAAVRSFVAGALAASDPREHMQRTLAQLEACCAA